MLTETRANNMFTKGLDLGLSMPVLLELRWIFGKEFPPAMFGLAFCFSKTTVDILRDRP
jgi:hypothetical protein